MKELAKDYPEKGLDTIQTKHLAKKLTVDIERLPRILRTKRNTAPVKMKCDSKTSEKQQQDSNMY